MASGDVVMIIRTALWTILRLAAPLLLTSLAIGLLVAIFQAATSIQEQTLTFVPKVMAIGFLLMILGPWMLTNLQDLFMFIMLRFWEI